MFVTAFTTACPEAREVHRGFGRSRPGWGGGAVLVWVVYRSAIYCSKKCRHMQPHLDASTPRLFDKASAAVNRNARHLELSELTSDKTHLTHFVSDTNSHSLRHTPTAPQHLTHHDVYTKINVCGSLWHVSTLLGHVRHSALLHHRPRSHQLRIAVE